MTVTRTLMREVPITELAASESLTDSIYHHSGELLHNVGERFPGDYIRRMRNSNILAVFLLSEEDDADRFVVRHKYRRVDVASLKEGQVLTAHLYGNHGVVLMPKGTKISSMHVNNLLAQNIKHAAQEKEPAKLNLDQVKKYFALIASEKTIGEGVAGRVRVEYLTEEDDSPQTHGGDPDETAKLGPGDAPEKNYASQLNPRQFKRFAVSLPCQFTVRDANTPMWEREVCKGTIEDLSQSGIQLLTKKRLSLLTVLDVLFSKNEKTDCAATVKVQRVIPTVNRDAYLIGCSFISLKDVAKKI